MNTVQQVDGDYFDGNSDASSEYLNTQEQAATSDNESQLINQETPKAIMQIRAMSMIHDN